MQIGYVAIVVSMLIWGSIGVVAKYIQQPSEVIVFFRVLLSFIFLLPHGALHYREVVKALKTKHFWLPISGLILACNWLFFFKALKVTSVANAVMSYYTAPLFVAVFAALFYKEQLQRRTILAFCLAFAGMAVMMVHPGSSMAAKDLQGIVWGLCAAVLYALVTILGRKLSDVPAFLLVFFQAAFAAAAFYPVVAQEPFAGLFFSGSWLGQGAPAGALRDLGLLAVVALVHTAGALGLYFYGLKRMREIQHVGILSYLDPVSAVVFAYLFLHEKIQTPTLVGGALVLFSTYLILAKKKTPEVKGKDQGAKAGQ